METDKNKLSSLAWILIGLLICWGANGLSLGSLRNPGPGFLPFICGASLILLGIALLFKSFKNQSASIKLNFLWLKDHKKIKMVLSVVALFGYTVAMEYIGFLLSTFIFMAFLLRIIEPYKWIALVLISLTISFICYYIFEFWFHLQFPEGLLKFF